MKLLFPLAAVLLLLFSCSRDAYDTGDGPLSYMRADFAEARTDAGSKFFSMTTDDGEQLNVSPAYTSSWPAKADTTYRVLAYYNKVSGEDGRNSAEILSLSQVAVPSVVSSSALGGKIKTDPVTFESAWMSSNGRYINLDLSVKTGSANDETLKQTFAIVLDSVSRSTDGKRLVALSLYHDQGGVPEYYSAKLYLSIPVTALPVPLDNGDEVQISVNTYKGEKVLKLKG